MVVDYLRLTTLSFEEIPKDWLDYLWDTMGHVPRARMVDLNEVARQQLAMSNMQSAHVRMLQPAALMERSINQVKKQGERMETMRAQYFEQAKLNV